MPTRGFKAYDFEFDLFGKCKRSIQEPGYKLEYAYAKNTQLAKNKWGVIVWI